MILQALTQYYQALLQQGAITRPGWSTAKVAWALDVALDGQIVGLYRLEQQSTRGDKIILRPQEHQVPQPVKRSSGVSPNFLCDTSSYLLGADEKGNPNRTMQCFQASRQLHCQRLEGVECPAAKAVVAFYENWNPAQAATHPALKQDWEELMKGGNLLFWHQGAPVTEDALVQASWQAVNEQPLQQQTSLCLVTGSQKSVARLHPNIKGVAGAQSSGAALVSFNAQSFCSYGHEQGENAPVSDDAAFAYTTALNHLLADRQHTWQMGDTTMVFWAEQGQQMYQDFIMEALYSQNPDQSQEVLSVLMKLAQGQMADWQGHQLNPQTPFYILGLAPNAARISVRFFWQNHFGLLARNVARHCHRMELVRPSFEPFATVPIWKILQETVNQKVKGAKPHPRLAGDLMLAVLQDGHYPATLLNGVLLRIRAEREITHGRAAILKAWYLKNSQNEQLKEVMTVELNEQTNYLPYVLGRLFAVLEAVQSAANPNIKATIRDRYFNTASATPAVVFPQLINLAQKHLNKLNPGLAHYYDSEIGQLYARLGQTLPARLTLPEQSAFQMGYYHQVQKRYKTKEEQ